jgi:glycerophosphoryl diester phosphodiesterase
MTSVRNIAHRGSSARAPENTLLAMALAVDEDGADGLELDLQRSRDGEVLVLHDATVERTTEGRGPAGELDLDALRALDAGFRFVDDAGRHPFRGRGLTIPTLREVLERFPDTWLSLDLKGGDDALQDRTVELLHEFRARERVVIGDERRERARRLRRIAPDFEHFFGRADAVEFLLRATTGYWRGYRPQARSMQVPVSVGPVHFDRRELVAAAHARGIAVRFWTINDTAAMRRLLDLGADGLITDHPDRLRDVLAGRELT